MSILSSGIEHVWACAIPSGIGRDGKRFDEPLSIIVSWKASYANKLYQVYVNGKYAAVTDDVKQRRLRVTVPSCMQSVSSIAVYAVEPANQYTDYSSMICGTGNAGRVALSWTRSESLPLGGWYEIYSNNGSGQIDYSIIAAGGKGILWDGEQYKSGFGLSGFGSGDYGYDGCGCVGFGRGEFGCGEHGFDSDLIRWISDELTDGLYQFAVKIYDSSGTEKLSAESEQIAVVRNATGTGRLLLDSSEPTDNMNFVLESN